MKKTIAAIAGVVLLVGSAQAVGFRAGVNGSLYSPEDSLFRDIYGGMARFGLEAGFDVARRVSLWAGIGYAGGTGEMTETKEETRVRLLPLTLDARYEIPVGGKLAFHAGAGLRHFFFREETPLGTVNENALGLLARAGGMYRLGKKLGAGLFLAWSTCSLKHEEAKFKVGGLELGAGLELRL